MGPARTCLRSLAGSTMLHNQGPHLLTLGERRPLEDDTEGTRNDQGQSRPEPAGSLPLRGSDVLTRPERHTTELPTSVF